MCFENILKFGRTKRRHVKHFGHIVFFWMKLWKSEWHKTFRNQAQSYQNQIWMIFSTAQTRKIQQFSIGFRKCSPWHLSKTDSKKKNLSARQILDEWFSSDVDVAMASCFVAWLKRADWDASLNNLSVDLCSMMRTETFRRDDEDDFGFRIGGRGGLVESKSHFRFRVGESRIERWSHASIDFMKSCELMRSYLVQNQDFGWKNCYFVQEILNVGRACPHFL